MSDETITITIKGGIDGKIATNLREIATQALSADTAVNQLKKALSGFNSANTIKSSTTAVKALSTEVNRATSAQKSFTTANNAAKTSLDRAASSATRYSAQVKGISVANAGLGKSFTNLNGVVAQFAATFAGIFAVQRYAAAQDALTSVQNQIRAVATGADEAAKLQDILFKLARDTRSGIEATTDAFVNFNKNLSSIGASTTEVLRIVETLNKGFIVSGKSAAEAYGSTRQFIQGLQNGALRGEEFNSIMEGFPVEIIKAFADELGISITQLRKAAEAGEITADVIRRAMGRAATDIDRMFANTLPTIGNAITELNNQFILFTESSSGGAQLLTQAIYLIAANLETLIPVVAGVGAAFALWKIGTLITELALLSAALAPTIVAIGAFALGFIGGVSAVYLLAEAVAFLTGQQEALTRWVQETAVGLDNLIGSIGTYANSALGMDKVNEMLAESNAQYKDMLTTIPQLTAGVQSYGGYMTQAATATSTTAKETQNLGQQLLAAQLAAVGVTGAMNTTAQAANSVAGAVTSISGQYNGVINVAEALRQTGSNAAVANDNLKVTVTELTSISGKSNGVYKVAAAITATGNAAKSATAHIEAYNRALAKSSNPDNIVSNLRPGESRGSFTNITGNRSGDSFRDVPKPPGFYKGGSIMVNGNRGVDKNYVGFRASNGERVDILTPAQQRAQAAAMRGAGSEGSAGPPVFIFNIETPDADSFRLSRQQLANTMHAALA